MDVRETLLCRFGAVPLVACDCAGDDVKLELPMVQPSDPQRPRDRSAPRRLLEEGVLERVLKEGVLKGVLEGVLDGVLDAVLDGVNVSDSLAEAVVAAAIAASSVSVRFGSKISCTIRMDDQFTRPYEYAYGEIQLTPSPIHYYCFLGGGACTQGD